MSRTNVSVLWRYPVKSMRGERRARAHVDARGIVGDRAYALVDTQTGKVASAKNPRLWPTLLSFGARYLEPPGPGGRAARLEVVFPDGTRWAGDDPALEKAVTARLGRPVRLTATAPPQPILEEYWPDLDDLAHRDEVTTEAMPPGTFFDCAAVHLLTTNTLDALRARYPAGDFDVGRFRPNVLLGVEDGGDFPEDAWIGRLIRIGSDVVLKVTGPAPRCVMTTLEQGELHSDLGILRAAAKFHDAHVGVYAEVVQGGAIGVGDVLAMAS